MRSRAALMLLALTVGWAGTAVRAGEEGGRQGCVVEVEPNDTPETAGPAGPDACLAGSLGAGDLVDHVVWTPGPEEAGGRWSISFASSEGVPAVLEISAIASDPTAPAVTLGATLAQLHPEGGAESPAEVDLLVKPGRYLLRATASAQPTGTPTTWRLAIAPGPPLPASGDQEPNDDPAHGVALDGSFEVGGDAAVTVDHYLWQVTDGLDALWLLELQGAAGTQYGLTLADAAGVILGDVVSETDATARLPDLRLPPGTYTVRLIGPPEGPAPYILRSSVQDVPTADPEPNDDRSRAIPLVPGKLAAGRLARTGDRDAYRLTVDRALGAVLLDAKLIVQSGPGRRLCLSRLDDEGGEQELSCDEGSRTTILRDLLLEPAEYLLVVMGSPSLLDPYYLRVDRTSAPSAGHELEPNDTPALATDVAPGSTMSGRGDGPDLFRVRVEGEPQLWEIEAVGPGAQLAWVQTDGLALGVGVDPDGTGERTLLNDVYLIPGDHWFRVDAGGEYQLRVLPLGPPIPGGEREPNNDLAFAEPIALDGSVTGRIGTSADTDFFRFSLAATERVRIRVEPPAESALSLYPQGDTAPIVSSRATPGPGMPIDLDLVLPAGDHAFLLAGPASEARYRVSLTREDPFDLAVDQEPNDTAIQARPLPADLRAEGTAAAGDVADWFRLAPLPGAGELAIDTEGSVRSVVLHDGSTEVSLTGDGDGTVYRTPALAAGATVSIGIVAQGPYAFQVDPGTTGLVAGVPAPGGLPVEVTLTVEASEVAAYEDLGQQVPASLTLTNTGSVAIDLELDAATSHHAWRVSLPEVTRALAPGATATVPMTIHVPADAWADEPVRVSVRARDGQRQATGHAEMTPRAGADLVGAVRAWSIPDAMLGGLDVASLGLGGVPLVSIDPVAESALHDGTVALGAGLDVVTALPLTLTVDLAGEEPVPVAGTILDPAAGTGGPAGGVRDFELLLSEDGVAYRSVLSGELSGALVEQAFGLDEPVMARFAQLRIVSRQPGSDRLRLGEWKVVATPGWQPGPGPLDIADPGLGGHVAWIAPQPPGPSILDGLIDADPMLTWLAFEPEGVSSVDLVLGFQDGRAAQVTAIEWADPAGSPDATLRLDRLQLSVSLDGPVGPWTPLGTWELKRDAAGAVASFHLGEPTWIRFVRMSAAIPSPERGLVELPGTIRVFEREPAEDYRSVAGEWGHASPAGPLEWQAPIDVPATDPRPPVATDAGGGGEALALVPGEPVSGRVSRGSDPDWYELSVPEGQTTARFTVSGRPTVGVGLALFDAAGDQVPMTVHVGARSGTVEHEALVVSGARYRLRVEQPPFSVVIAYDTSASIADYVPLMAAALRSYSRGIAPGEEALQLIAFEGPPLVEDFTDDPWLLQNGLDRYAGSATGSSAAETGLIDAIDLVARREGARAVLIMTDSETSSFDRHTELWRRLAFIRPQVFAIRVGGAFDPAHDERAMQDWAASGGGFYEYARSAGAMAHAFDRMATWLRRPAAYGLLLELSAEPPPPPEPGRVRVVSQPGDGVVGDPDRGDGDGGTAAISMDVAVELVLDTSGSMLRKVGRKRRIDVAKSVLGRLVRERIAPGTPVALRVFRQEPRSCDSELAVPLAPLDPDALAATIDGLEVQRTVSTPLAAAISAVAADLAAVAGPRVVVVVTDGEESCGGDPEAAMRALVEQGFELSVNVVGLGLERKVRRQMERLATAGEGTYYDARDADGLSDALRAALGAPFVVVDGVGAVIGRGSVDGAPVELPPGAYAVRLVGASGPPLGVAVIESGDEVVLVARGPAGAGAGPP